MKEKTRLNLEKDNIVKIKSFETESSIQNESRDADIAMNKMIKITIICIVFLIIEVIGGIWANSLAILSDAAHLTSDLSGFVISIIAIYIGKKKPNKTYTFGYYRAEVIGAMVSVFTIWILTGILLKEAVDRFLNPSVIDAPIMLFTAVFGLICNLAMMKVLHSGHDHSHGGHGGCNHGHMSLDIDMDISQLDLELEDKSVNSLGLIENNSTEESKSCSHGHSHDHEHSHGPDHNDHEGHEHKLHKKSPIHSHEHKKHKHSSHDHTETNNHPHPHEDQNDHHDHHHEENVNIRAALIHIIGDIIQSVGVVIAAILIYYNPNWVIVDPFCTVVFSIIVLFTTINITKQCIIVLMEASPRKFDAEKIEDNLKSKVKKDYII